MTGAQNFTYSWQFPFERHFDHVFFAQWARDTRPHSVAICLLYLLLIYVGQKWMAKRPAMDLRLPLGIWNGLLAVFSVVGALRLSQEFLHSLEMGWRYSICDNSRLPLDAVGFWLIAFMLSKVVELVDTAFIVLRKRPLLFLHWYHHITVLLLTWFAVGAITSTGRWYANMNYAVHAVMYSYYALSSFGWKIPRSVALMITSLQIAQMVMGLIVTVAASIVRFSGDHCEVETEIIAMFFLVYFTYFLLFVKYFYNTYVVGKRPAKSTEQNGTADLNTAKLVRKAINERKDFQTNGTTNGHSKFE